LAGWFAGLATLLLFIPATAAAVSAGKLSDVAIVGHFFTTRAASGNRYLTVQDAEKARVIVLKVSATAPEDDTTLFAPDFVLIYHRSTGREDRANCDGIATGAGDELYDYQDLDLSQVPTAHVKRGHIYFSLVFVVESDVDSVELHRIDSLTPLTHAIGSQRPYSVYITANTAVNMLSPIRAAIARAGYQITGATDLLAKETTGVTIHYQEKAEKAAREIAKILAAEFRVSANIQQTKLVGAHDIVIWFGE